MVALPSILSQPAFLPLAVDVDACLLCVTLGDADFKSALRTIETVGRDRWVGSVAGRRPSRRSLLKTFAEKDTFIESPAS